MIESFVHKPLDEGGVQFIKKIYKVKRDAPEWKIQVERLNVYDGNFDVKWVFDNGPSEVLAEGSLHFDNHQTMNTIRIINDFDLTSLQEPVLLTDEGLPALHILLYETTNDYLLGPLYHAFLILENCCNALSITMTSDVYQYQGLVLHRAFLISG